MERPQALQIAASREERTRRSSGPASNPRKAGARAPAEPSASSWAAAWNCPAVRCPQGPDRCRWGERHRCGAGGQLVREGAAGGTSKMGSEKRPFCWLWPESPTVDPRALQRRALHRSGAWGWRPPTCCSRPAAPTPRMLPAPRERSRRRGRSPPRPRRITKPSFCAAWRRPTCGDVRSARRRGTRRWRRGRTRCAARMRSLRRRSRRRRSPARLARAFPPLTGTFHSVVRHGPNRTRSQTVGPFSRGKSVLARVRRIV